MLRRYLSPTVLKAAPVIRSRAPGNVGSSMQKSISIEDGVKSFGVEVLQTKRLIEREHGLHR